MRKTWTNWRPKSLIRRDIYEVTFSHALLVPGEAGRSLWIWKDSLIYKFWASQGYIVLLSQKKKKMMMMHRW